jgi:Domain of unknown function (DUF222)
MVLDPVDLLADVAAAAACAAALPTDPTAYSSLADDDLMCLARSGADLAKAATRHNAVIAGELARRSTRELGHAGLAQRQGFRTPEELVRVVTGTTAKDAGTAVRIGKVLGTASDPAASEQPWLAPVAVALSAGTLSVAGADAIRTGIGTPTAEITVDILTAAVARLVAEATTGGMSLDADALLRRAHEVRDEIDEAGIADREAALRDKRALWFKRNPDGTARINWTLDPESAAVCGELFDRATSPKRGGPRFVSGPNAVRAEEITADPRTTDQLASDVFLELLRQGAAADSSQLLGTGAPVVNVHVTQENFLAGKGHGYLESSQTPVSMGTVERAACSGGVVEVIFDEHLNPIDVTPEQRLFTKKQRRALAARDGGCMWRGCKCPASWTEAHHARQWKRDHGPTTIENGILLCRFHHLLLHNNGWEILRDENGFWLIPPRTIDPAQTPIALGSKSAALKDARRDRERDATRDTGRDQERRAG